jgi:hypothetical protein
MLNRKLEKFAFRDPAEVLIALGTVLSTIPRDGFISVFDEWKCRLRQYIDRKDEYISTD